MRVNLGEILDIPSLRQVFEAYSKANGLTLALLDLDGKVHIATGWQDVCVQYHRANSQSAARCLESDTVLSSQSNQGMKFNIYNCKNGLVDVAMPVYVYGEHVANFFTGQFFFEKPNIEQFREQAKKFGYSEDDYIASLLKVPVFTKEEVENNMNFLVELTEIFGKMGVQKIDLLNKQISDVREVTEKKAKEKIKNLELQMRDADYEIRAKSEFLSSMSHELRTPLNAIIGLSELMSLDSELSSKNKEYLNVIGKASDHLLALVNDVLELSKIEADAINIKLENLSLNTILSEAEMLTKTNSTRFNIPVKFNYPSGNLIVIADSVRFLQVLFNLITNAIKYNRPGGNVNINVVTNKSYAEIHVEDTGPGISQEKQIYLFEAFNRLGAENSNIEGTGIGLIIAKKLIEHMNGSIHFSSTPGKGSDFWIKMPISLEKQEQVTKPDTPNTTHQDSKELSNQKTVVYFEDNPESIYLMQQILESENQLELKVFTDVEQGIEFIKTGRTDLVLMDINMPGKNGFDVMKTLKKLDKKENLPIIAISASALPEDIDKGISAGFNAYLTKPLRVSSFRETLFKYL